MKTIIEPQQAARSIDVNGGGIRCCRVGIVGVIYPPADTLPALRIALDRP